MSKIRWPVGRVEIEKKKGGGREGGGSGVQSRTEEKAHIQIKIVLYVQLFFNLCIYLPTYITYLLQIGEMGRGVD